MLRLPVPADELSWLDLLPGVRVRVRSATPAAMIAARAEAGQAYRPENAPEGEEAPDNRRWNAAELLVRALARYAIVEWEGVGSAEGEPVPVTPANVDGLMKVWRAFDAFDRLYVMPVLAEGEEKNG
ncbi:hypothetical protein B2G69_06430 [Methylorubrum zatmanii]|nr:hypothetical protein [Methylorubrum zatmanii]ARO53823.1 hypothetical protein B2G69_06430 [Methylorubrum zatmanii]